MVGQHELHTKLNSLLELPKSLILVGDKGCGKHTFVKLIADRFQYELIDFSDVDKEQIEKLYEIVTPAIYLIAEPNEKKQSTLLKLLEEPPVNVYLIVLTTSVNHLLPTVVNRCQIWSFSPYDLFELMQFTENKELIKIANTPGKILAYTDFDFDYYISLADKIVKHISRAQWSNLFKLTEVFDYKSNAIDLFIPLLQHQLFSEYKESNEEKLYKKYFLVKQLQNSLTNVNNVDKQKLFESAIFGMKLCN